MAVYKCKMCGGTLEVTDNQSVAECDYCGTKQTLPTAQDETLQKLFNRANILRMKSEFDKAAELYEKLIQMKPDEAEAYWGLILCKYGIEYVEDPKTLSRIPTCHRASFSSVVADEDYKSALSYSDTLQKTIYESEAKEIDRLQKEIIDISRNESPYDIFICYKETDSDGKRTQDSVIANEIYHQLTAEGYKVFYAAITLEDKLGTEYEPYIFAALHSARVMLVVGTKPEYFNAVWVKNEWSRYLHLLKSDRSKLLIPCYRDMDPYELPEEFAHLQAQDMSKIGFINDLIRGIKKVVKKEAEKPKEKPIEKETVVVDSVLPSVQALLERGYMALEDGEWERADAFFEQVLNYDARNGKAYLGKFLAKEKKPDFDSVIKSHLRSTSSTKYKSITVVNRDSGTENEIIESYVVDGYLSAEELRGLFYFNGSITSCVENRTLQLYTEKNYFQKDKNLMRAIEYGVIGLSEQLDSFFAKLSKRLDEAKRQEQTDSDLQRTAYSEMLVDVEKKAEKMKEDAEEKREKDYQNAIKLANRALTMEEKQKPKKASIQLPSINKIKSKAYSFFKKVWNEEHLFENTTIKEHWSRLSTGSLKKTNIFDICKSLQEAIDALQKHKGYKETDEYLCKLQKRLSMLQTKIEQRKKMTQKYRIINTVVALLLLLLILLFTTNIIIPSINYHKAMDLMNNGDYYHAIQKFDNANNFKDSEENKNICWAKLANRKTISADYHTVALQNDGTVVATGSQRWGQCDVMNWRNIEAISAGSLFTLGLKKDGTVIAVGRNYWGECEVDSWTNIVAIDADSCHSLGLKADGSVVATGSNEDGQCDVTSWSDIISISAGNDHSLGLKSDGTVVAVGKNDVGQCDVSTWTDIVAISAGFKCSLGLKSNGTVVATGRSHNNQLDVYNWRDIVSIDVGLFHTIGLKSDGTVVTAGSSHDVPQLDVSKWKDIVAVSVGTDYAIGLKADGTVLSVGYNENGRCNVSDWTNIKVPKK